MKKSCTNCRKFLRQCITKRIKGKYDATLCGDDYSPVFDDDKETKKVDKLK